MKRHDCRINESLIEAMIDGELDASSRSRLEVELAECEQCQALAQALAEMREVLQAHSSAVTDAVDFGGLWPAIASRLEAEGHFALDPLQLQAFADGELEGRELIKAADSMARSESAHRQMDAMAELGDLLRARVNAVADTVDFGLVWQRLDAQVGAEIEAKGQLPVASAHEPLRPRTSWWEKTMAAIGGYRAVLMSAVTAAVVVILLLPVLLRDHQESTRAPVATTPETLEIRVVHVNEVVSHPGHQVTVDSYDGYAPVIYIQAEDDEEEESPRELLNEPDGGNLYTNPI